MTATAPRAESAEEVNLNLAQKVFILIGRVCRSKRIVSKSSALSLWLIQMVLKSNAFFGPHKKSCSPCVTSEESECDGAREWHFFFVVGQEVYQHARFVGKKIKMQLSPLFGSELECSAAAAPLQLHFTVY